MSQQLAKCSLFLPTVLHELETINCHHYCQLISVYDEILVQLVWRLISSRMKLFEIVLIFFVLCENVFSYRFLAVLPVTSKSHYYIGHNLMKGLADQGHQVTVVSPFKVKTPINNYEEVYLEYSWEVSRKSKLSVPFTKFDMKFRSLQTLIHLL